MQLFHFVYVLANRSCPGDLFRCKNYNCIPSLWRCDGDNDCGDNSDEDGCSKSTCAQTLRLSNNENYTFLEYKCLQSYQCVLQIIVSIHTCIERPPVYMLIQLKCCFVLDSSCDQEASFRCEDGICITKNLTCDGKPDCGLSCLVLS